MSFVADLSITPVEIICLCKQNKWRCCNDKEPTMSFLFSWFYGGASPVKVAQFPVTADQLATAIAQLRPVPADHSKVCAPARNLWGRRCDCQPAVTQSEIATARSRLRHVEPNPKRRFQHANPLMRELQCRQYARNLQRFEVMVNFYMSQ